MVAPTRSHGGPNSWLCSTGVPREFITTTSPKTVAMPTLIKRGEEVLAEVQSTWCSLDSDTRRPSRLARDVVSRFLPD